MKEKIFSLFDYVLLFAVIGLISIGVMFIYSAEINSKGILLSDKYIKQIIFAVLGLLLLIGITIFDYRKFKQWILYIYIGYILILIYTRLFGTKVNGARSWLGFAGLGIQPSEIGKIVFILFLAKYLEASEKVAPLKRFFMSLGIMMLPVGLILIQPDFGTAMVYIPIFFIMCYMANVPRRYLLCLLLYGACTVVMSVLPIWQEEIHKKTVTFLKILLNGKLRLVITAALGAVTLISLLGYIFFKNRFYYWFTYGFGIVFASIVSSLAVPKVLKPYQIKRLIIFLDPYSDPKGAGWNIIQSKIAIGSGGVFGRGWLNGTQSHLRFLPEQSTDFIFSILSEEWGFFGCVLVFFLFLVIILRGLNTIRKTTNVYGYYIGVGIVGMLFFHFIVNVGMVMGIMPVTGIPLPFLSYGGSSLLTAMASVGLLMSINLRRMDF